MTRHRVLVALLVTALSLGAPQSGFAYLVFATPLNGHQVVLRWNRTPVTYFVTNAGVPGVTPDDLKSAVGRAFATWEAVPTASISYSFVGFTTAEPGEDDGLTTLGFQSRPDLDRVLGATTFLVDSVTGELLEADIFFNSAFTWSVAPSGDANAYDFESVALHEIGHLSGLGHSALGETEMVNDGRRVVATDSVMFPIAFPMGFVNRTLHADDVAGLSDLYPDNSVRETTGSISGRVTKDGIGLFGAHIVAFNPATGAMVAGFSLDAQGHFVIGNLRPGPYIVRTEPLDDADTDSFLDGPIDVDFRVAFSSRYVIVPRGGDSGETDIQVVRK